LDSGTPMKSKIYLETTIVSYLTARASRDLVLAAHQQLTREWWEIRSRFDLFISELVLREISSGDIDAASRRHKAVEGLDTLAMNENPRAWLEFSSNGDRYRKRLWRTHCIFQSPS
jgi:hypothetical protein